LEADKKQTIENDDWRCSRRCGFKNLRKIGRQIYLEPVQGVKNTAML
jgi:hypothetical protein